MTQGFGADRDHNRHFVILTVVVLVAGVGALYILNSFGYFGIGFGGDLTEEKCLQLFSNDADVSNIGFLEYSDGENIIKETTVSSGPKLIRLAVEQSNDNSSIRCSISARETSTIFTVKGIGSSEYSCGDVKVSYTGGSQDGYFYVIEEIELPESTTIQSTASRPEGESGIPEVDSQLQELPEQLSGELEFSFGDNRYLQTITYSSSQDLYEKTLQPLRSRTCPGFFELISQ